MNEFLQRHDERIVGVLSGFDRVLFQGTLRSISCVEALAKFLSAKHILYKEFGAFAQDCAERIARRAKAVAERAGRPYIYLERPGASKEDPARRIAQERGIEKGLVCVLYAVEPRQAFDLYRNREQKRLELVSRQRKRRFFYSRDVMRFLSGKQRGSLADEVVTRKHERPEGVRIKHTVNANFDLPSDRRRPLETKRRMKLSFTKRRC